MRKSLLAIIAAIFIIIAATDANATNYHVRKGGGAGNGTSWSNSWDDINNITGIGAGDTVYIAAGDYTGTYTFTSSGTNGSQITIKRATTSEHGSETGWAGGYDGAVTINSASGTNTFTVTGRNFITIDGVSRENFTIYGNGSRRPNRGIYGTTTGSNAKIIIQNVTIHDMYYTGILLANTDGVEIASCEIYKNGYNTGHDSDGNIVINNYSGGTTYGRSSIHDSYLHDPGWSENHAATDIVTGVLSNFDIYDNHFYTGWSTAWGSSDALHISGNENKIYNNTFEGTYHGNNQLLFIHTENPAVRSPTNNTIYNNLFYSPIKDSGSTNCGASGMLSLMTYGTTISNLYVYNNTFYGYYKSIFFNQSGGGGYSNIYIKNNILWPSNASPCGSGGWTDWGHIKGADYIYTATPLDYNYYRWSTRIWETSRSFSTVQGNGKEVHGGYGDPLFSSTTSTAGFDLTASTPSPAKDGGIDLSSVFTTDKDGYTRALWDMGAYELQTESSDTTPPDVSISSPATGATVTGDVTISSSATDTGGMLGVQLKVNGVNQGAEDIVSPYSIVWNTLLVSDGTYTLAAVARDTSGNLATSTTITVTVDNNYTPPPAGVVTADEFTLADPMALTNDPGVAPGDYYVATTATNSGSATISFEIAETGGYKISCGVYATSTGDDSMLVSVNGADDEIWDFNRFGIGYNEWREADISIRGLGSIEYPEENPGIFILSAGTNTVELNGREIGARVAYCYPTLAEETGGSAPVITVASHTAASFGRCTPITLTATDSTSMTYMVIDQDEAPVAGDAGWGTSPAQYCASTSNPYGRKTLWFAVKDSAGNVSTQSVQWYPSSVSNIR